MHTHTRTYVQWVYVYTHTCMHTHTRTYVQWVYVYTHTCIHALAHVCTHIEDIQVRAHTKKHACFSFVS